MNERKRKTLTLKSAWIFIGKKTSKLNVPQRNKFISSRLSECGAIESIILVCVSHISTWYKEAGSN
jgi:hypothetical protein